jgi:GAF domain-containing protein
MAVPMLRKDQPIGAIAVTRGEVKPFSEREVALLRTFADQAVIAIENVRLFTELQQKNDALTQAHAQVTEALEQQTATAEILQVISSSPTDVQPTFDAIAVSATRLCEGEQGTVFRFDGRLIHMVAHNGGGSLERETLQRLFPRPPGRGTLTSRAILTGSVQQADIAADPEHEHREIAAFWGTVLSVPMLREGVTIGAITVRRRERRPFSAKQIALLETFANQAVIAIENVRLFTELRARTAELMRSVEQLTALSEVSRAVSSTLDLEMVLNTIVARAVQLSGARAGVIFEYDEATQEFRLRVTHGVEQELVELFQAAPIRLGEGATGQAAALRAPVQIRDIQDEREYAFARLQPVFARLGYRSGLVVPFSTSSGSWAPWASCDMSPGTFRQRSWNSSRPLPPSRSWPSRTRGCSRRSTTRAASWRASHATWSSCTSSRPRCRSRSHSESSSRACSTRPARSCASIGSTSGC